MILELGAGADILRAIGFMYWILMLGIIALTWWLGRKWWLKIALSLIVLAIFISPQYWAIQRENEANVVWLAKYEPAKAIFDDRCKAATPRILRTVENVDSVLLLRIRTANNYVDWEDAMWPSAGLPKESFGDAYIGAFLLDRNLVEWQAPSPGKAWRIVNEIGGNGRRGFRYVDVIDSQDGRRLRFKARIEKHERDGMAGNVKLIADVPNGPAPRYAVTFEDNVDPELRKRWIAGTLVKVIDTKLQETIAEQWFWNFDEGLGSKDQRTPWTTSHSQCPKTTGVYGTQTHEFVDKVLISTRGK